MGQDYIHPAFATVGYRLSPIFAGWTVLEKQKFHIIFLTGLKKIMTQEIYKDLPAIEPSLAKRIKRQITARPQSFFAVTPPGFETLCLEEIQALSIPEGDASVIPGGVSFSGHLHDCYAANLHSRIASRILMRITEFKATAFGPLEKKLSDIPWELYFYPGMLPKISVTAHKSRLYHKGAVAERALGSISKRLGTGPATNTIPAPQIFIRIVSDRLTISIDSSGDLLYKRGIKTFGSKAPLRETLAAATLKLAGFSSGDILLDPMCGSGSFSIEAAMITLNTPPGWYREFAFMAWPAFRPKRWAHIKKTAAIQIKESNKICIFSSDSHEKACGSLEKRLAAYEFSKTVKVTCIDFLEMTPKMLTTVMDGTIDRPGGKRLVVLNPPYGRRLGSKANAATLYQQIKEKLSKDFKGWQFAVIGPHHFLKGKIPFPHQRFPLFHGGLSLTLLIGRIV